MKLSAIAGGATMFALATVACDSDRALGPEEDQFQQEQHLKRIIGDNTIGVMTRNMYVGADVDAVIAALVSDDPADDVPTLLAAIETLGNTAYPLRAAAFTDEIERLRPHVVGLQEVSKIDIDLSGLGLPVVIDLDFLPILEAELAARGLNYAVAASVKNIDATPLPGIRLVDYDVMLVDASRVTVNSALGKNFDLNVGEIAPGVALIRGYVVIEADINHRTYTIASAHTEPDLGPAVFDQLRAAQVGEIVAVLGDANPAFIMGDLNDEQGSLMYQVLRGAGFKDSWPELRPSPEGLTCCHLNDLSNPLPNTFDKRIDFIWARGMERRGRLRGRIIRTGFLPFSRIDGPAYPIWPSDHAGLVARLSGPR